MQYGARVGQESFANLAGLPGILRHVERHVNHDRRTDDVVARNAAPETAVVRVGTVVAHREITIVGNLVWKLDVGVAGRRASRRGWVARADRIRFFEFLAVDVHRTATE